jgi:hypothetical protein
MLENMVTLECEMLQGSSKQVDCLVLNHLPFAEDLRVAKFASLDENPDLVPTMSQLESIRSVVIAFELATGKHREISFVVSEFCVCLATKFLEGLPCPWHL